MSSTFVCNLNQFPSALCPGQENLIKGNITKRKLDRVEVLLYCTSSQRPLTFYEVSTKSLKQFWSYAADTCDGQRDAQMQGDHYHIL